MSNYPRIWGRVYSGSTYTWVAVTPDANGNTDYVYITNLIQVLKLNLNESPFYANYGIPAQRTVIQQVFPDFYVNQVQSQFAPYFASLTITKVTNPAPMYKINLVTHQGVTVNTSIPV